MKRVTAGKTYIYKPVLLDIINPPHNIKAEDKVRVINLPGCPKANTMGHCHVEHLNGIFAGLVCTNSLVKWAYLCNTKKAAQGVK